MTLERLALGRMAEDEAAAWYRRRGYVVVARNWRCREGEVDLVALRPRDRLVVFVEVKARRAARYGTAAEAVGPDKQRRVRTVALRFLHHAGVRAQRLRFDVAAWDAGALTVTEEAF